MKKVATVVGKVALAALVLVVTGCVVDPDYRDDRHGYGDRHRHRHYYERSDYRYGRDRYHARHHHHSDRYREYYGRGW